MLNCYLSLQEIHFVNVHLRLAKKYILSNKLLEAKCIIEGMKHDEPVLFLTVDNNVHVIGDVLQHAETSPDYALSIIIETLDLLDDEMRRINSCH